MITALKKLIRTSEITQCEIAKKVEISETTLIRISKNEESLLKTNFGTILKLCKVLKCTPMDLYRKEV